MSSVFVLKLGDQFASAYNALSSLYYCYKLFQFLFL